MNLCCLQLQNEINCVYLQGDCTVIAVLGCLQSSLVLLSASYLNDCR